MSFTDIKSKIQEERGFTIVELLIVIVVIGILAAITIVAYNGVTNRANAVKAQTNAAAVQKVAEAFRADTANPGYPEDNADLQAYNGLSKVPTGVTVLAAAADVISASTGTANVSYKATTGETGGCIGWWDYSAASSNLKFVYVGDAKTGAAATCSST